MSLAYLAEALASPPGQVLRYALRGAPLPRASATLAAGAFRAAVLSALHAATGGRESFLLSGHDAKGIPDRGHRHAYYLPLFAGQNDLTGLLVLSPHERFSAREVDALAAVRAIRWGGASTRTSVELLDLDDRSCFQVATRWISATPYAPLRRHWGTSGKRHLAPECQLADELSKALPSSKITDVKSLTTTRARLRLGRNAPSRPQWQLAFNYELRLESPLCGPIALGHSCHFGLGLFMPERS
jgi:CRISPR-associated protein Csb2